MTDFGWPVVPEGLTELLATFRDRYGDRLPPVVITENGCSYEGVDDQDRRIAYLDGHLRAAAPGPRGGRGRARLLRLVAAGQLRVGGGVRAALRPGPRRLRDAGAHPEGVVRLAAGRASRAQAGDG